MPPLTEVPVTMSVTPNKRLVIHNLVVENAEILAVFFHHGDHVYLDSSSGFLDLISVVSFSYGVSMIDDFAG